MEEDTGSMFQLVIIIACILGLLALIAIFVKLLT